VFATFAERFVAEGDTRITPRPDQKRVTRDFVVDDATVKEFKDFLAAQKVTVEEDLFAKDSDFIRAMIRYDIDLALFGLSEARRNLLSKDPQALFALQLFPEAEKLADLRKAKGIRPSINH
jgi:carboxyl-terminal processing protease